MAKAAAGNATRFLTLTVNPSQFTNPAERLRALSWAWRTVVKRLKREYGKTAISYLAVVEETKAGEPHLHILLRSPYIPQAYLSACMGELINSPIVDIRRIRNTREVIRYVAKYITKAPAQFEGSKRYWCSQDWEPKDDIKSDAQSAPQARWEIWPVDIFTVARTWLQQGFISRREEGETIIGFPWHDYLIQRQE